jgi:hypothetical protein
MPVSPGDPFRPTARDWNKIQDNLPSWQGPNGRGQGIASMPAETALLRWIETRDPVLGEAVVMRTIAPRVDELPTTATVPIDPEMTLTDDEKAMWGSHQPIAELMEPVLSAPRADDHIAICVSPRQKLFAIRGFAWVRVRLLRKWHRFARRCLPQEGDTVIENENSVGCLDSCAWGPVEIIYMANELDFSDGWFWAFVRF